MICPHCNKEIDVGKVIVTIYEHEFGTREWDTVEFTGPDRLEQARNFCKEKNNDPKWKIGGPGQWFEAKITEKT